jgi:hypothetical protein
VAEIIFYHRPHTRVNGEPAHGKHDLDSIARTSFFAPRMSQALKDHIWTQLGLGYTVKQIYDKHKAIWWARINAGEAMMRDDFITQQDITYLDRKHKKGSWRLHQNLTISLRTWAFSHPDDVFYFQDANEDNGIHVPFTIGIQTRSQLQAMVSIGDNGVISMDATFGTNDVKFHLFTLMVFDAHCTGVPVAWIIPSRQTCDDLVEWLTPLKTKLQRKNPKWKPSCFIVDDVPQELRALR